MLDGLGVCRTTEREISSLEPIIHGGIHKTGFREVLRHDFRLARHDVGKPLLEYACNLAVQLLSTALEQALIGRIPYQRVLETVNRFGRLATAKHELSVLELGECVLQIGLGASSHRAQQGIGEIASDGGADLTNFLHRRETVEP